jgi:adenosylmethionine-8-amino-7-oxononanoate aminotransferase
MTIAKGLGGGYQPIGAMLVSGAIVDAIRAGSGAFMHGHTYVGHAAACAAAVAVQQVVRSEDLVTRVRDCGARFEGMLRRSLGSHYHVGDIRGRGLFWGIELVCDRSTKAPFDPSFKVHAHVKKEALARGLLCYPMGGTIDGRLGDHILLAPPYIVSDAEMEDIVDRLQAAMAAALPI